MKDRKIGEEKFFWALHTLCAMHRRPYSAEMARQQFPAPHSVALFLRAGEAMGFDTDLRKCAPAKLHKETFPLLAWLVRNASGIGADPSAPAAADALSVAPVLVLQANATHVLVIESGGATPVTIELAQFAARYGGQVSRFTPQHDATVDPDSEEQARQARKFGFSWFLPKVDAVFRLTATGAQLLPQDSTAPRPPAPEGATARRHPGSVTIRSNVRSVPSTQEQP